MEGALPRGRSSPESWPALSIPNGALLPTARCAPGCWRPWDVTRAPCSVSSDSLHRPHGGPGVRAQHTGRPPEAAGLPVWRALRSPIQGALLRCVPLAGHRSRTGHGGWPQTPRKQGSCSGVKGKLEGLCSLRKTVSAKEGFRCVNFSKTVCKTVIMKPGSLPARGREFSFGLCSHKACS